MKILLITDEVWNDYVHPNGVLTNWFSGFDAEFAQIYCSPGLPNNNICKKYYQITDAQMAKSLISAYKAGGVVDIPDTAFAIERSKKNAQRTGIYGFFKKVSMWCYMPTMIMRDLIWRCGRYNMDTLRAFVTSYNPDIVFCPRLGTHKLLRLEQIVKGMTDAPFVAFTADDEASLNQRSFNLLFWLRRLSFRRVFKKHVKIYQHYFTFSNEQSAEYTRDYGITSDTLYKCGDFATSLTPKTTGIPIRIVYAGRLYCNRWKTLTEIGKALKVLNTDTVKAVLDIYTIDNLTRKQKQALKEDNYIYLKGSVSASELLNVYKNADIALHVESLDKKYRQDTKVSFSTKIIDLMNSTCAIIAICWNQHTGYQYLHDHDAAICIDNFDGILPTLCKIVNNPDMIREYAEKAYQCGKQNHNRAIIQKQIKDKFEEIIQNSNH